MDGPGTPGADSVSLDALQDSTAAAEKAGTKGVLQLGLSNYKILVALFLIFVVVVSEFFTNSIVAGFGEKAVQGRSPTAWGTVIQGIFLVIFYIVALYLIGHGVV